MALQLEASETLYYEGIMNLYFLESPQGSTPYLAIETDHTIGLPVEDTPEVLEIYSSHLLGNEETVEMHGERKPKTRDECLEKIKKWHERWKTGDYFSAFVFYRKERPLSIPANQAPEFFSQAVQQAKGEPIGHAVLGHGSKKGEAEFGFVLRKKIGDVVILDQGYEEEIIYSIYQAYAPWLKERKIAVNKGSDNESSFAKIFATSLPENRPVNGTFAMMIGKPDKTEERFGSLRNFYYTTPEEMAVARQMILWQRV